MTTIFYDFHEFAKSGEYKQCDCARTNRKFYPCSKMILDSWADKFSQAELLRTSQLIQLGTWVIRPKTYYSTTGFRENEKLNFHCCVIKRK